MLKKSSKFKDKREALSGDNGDLARFYRQGLIQDITGTEGTTTTLRGHAQAIAQITHTAAALLNRITDLAIGDSTANADIHESGSSRKAKN